MHVMEMFKQLYLFIFFKFRWKFCNCDAVYGNLAKDYFSFPCFLGKKRGVFVCLKKKEYIFYLFIKSFVKKSFYNRKKEDTTFFELSQKKNLFQKTFSNRPKILFIYNL